MIINELDYFGLWQNHPDVTPAIRENARTLLARVNALLALAEKQGVKLKRNGVTGSYVSGAKYGGFRPQCCTQGAPLSSHKVGRGVDIYDPDNALDNWLTDALLTAIDLYREHPDDTDGWCHLTDRAPGSKKRTFKP